MYKTSVSWLKTNADIILITLAAIVLRMKDILKYDFWYDEAFTGNLMRVGSSEFWKIVHQDPHPPLFSALLRAWSTLTGVNDFTLRFLPLIFGVLTVVLIYFFCKEMFNKETAALAAAIAAINPFLIEYSVEARSYSLYGLLTLLAAYFILKKKAVLFVITTMLLIYTHYMAITFLTPLFLYYFWTIYKNKLNPVRYLALLIPIFIFAIFIYYPLVTNKTYGNLNIDWVKKADLLSLPRSVTAFSYGVRSKAAGTDELMHVNFILNENILGGIIFVLFLIGVVTVFIKKFKDKKAFADFGFVVLMTLLPMLTLILYVILRNHNVYVERYLFPSSIFFAISLGYILTSLLNFEVAGILLFFYVYTLLRTASPGYYTGMKLLAKDFRNSPVEIVFTSPIDFTVGKYYLNNGMARLYVPKEPSNQSYFSWPFIGDAFPRDMSQAIFISPDPGRMTSEFIRPLDNFQYGNYQIWLKK